MVIGGSIPAALWAPLMAHLPGRTLYAMDLPGFGLTDPVRYHPRTYRATATAFLADLRTSGALKVRASRPPFEMHDAHFRWDREDKTLKDVLAACQGRMLDTDRRTSDPDDDNEALDDAIKDVLPEQRA